MTNTQRTEAMANARERLAVALTGGTPTPCDWECSCYDEACTACPHKLVWDEHLAIKASLEQLS